MKLLLVEDHPLFREGIRHALLRLGVPIEVIFAASVAEARELIRQHRDIALTLLDYHLPDGDGLILLQTILDSAPTATVIMLSAEQNTDLIKAALSSGAKGFITKSSTLDVMLSAIRLVLAGGVYVPPDVLGQASARSDSVLNSELKPSSDPNVSAATLLTARQLEVLALLAKGLSNKEIARDLAMSPSTVKVHVAAILKECNVKNRTQAVSFARQHGLLSG